MACNDNISNLCMEPIKATCVDYDGPLGENTTIKDDCVNQIYIFGPFQFL